MKETLKNLSIALLIILIIIKRPVLIEAIISAINIWLYSVFPAIFPFLMISDLILSSNLINIITYYLSPVFNHLFKVSGYGAYVFMMSLISGTPSNAKYVKDLLDNNLINYDEAVKILSMSLLYNPLLILAITSFLKPKDQLLVILLNILINLIIGICNRNINCNFQKRIPMIPKKFNLINSISNTINTLLLILGAIVLYASLASLLPIYHPLLVGSLEIVSGLTSIEIIHNYHHALLFTGILMAFGGLSIQTQIKSILKDYPLEYSLFYKSRIIHLILFIILIKIYFLII